MPTLTTMKPLVQKLPLPENNSFIAQTFRTPHFEVGWHQHDEYELILFTQGRGTGYVGDHVGPFDTGDIYFLGAHLPHTFQKEDDVITSAIVVQFTSDFWGERFMQLPENKKIKQLFAASQQGLKIAGKSRNLLQQLVSDLENATGIRRILLLGECLDILAERREYSSLSLAAASPANTNDWISKVFSYTHEHFRDNISLTQVSAIACLSVPAFCAHFKRSTQKTYIDYLNEVRIGYACTQLTSTEHSVIDICYSSGYNTMGHFHRQFLKMKGMTPLQYRKNFSDERISKGKLIGIV
jgi:AraC-like DNA-binding protein